MLDIEKIENKYNLEELKYKDFKIWNYLRGVYGPYSLFKHRGVKNKNTIEKIKNKTTLLKDSFYGIHNYFKSYDYIIFGDTDSLKLIDDKYHDRMAHGIMEYFGIDKFLYIENKNKKRYFRQNSSTYKKASAHLLSLFANVVYLLSRKDTISFKVLDEINSEFKMNIDYSASINKFISAYNIYTKLFKIKKPKAVFVTCFTKRAIVKAANDLNIPTIEFQHGVISDNYAYNSPIKSDHSFHSKYLLVYGNNDKRLFDEYNYIKNKRNIFAIGSYYINYLKASNIDLKINKKYKYKIVVSMQSPIANDMIEFIENVACELNDMLFILVPRVEMDLKTFKEMDNVKVFKYFDCYQIANQCDIHVSGYSSCVIEAPALGLTNIFINFKGLSKYYFEKYIDNKSYNYVVDTEKEFINLLRNINIKDKKSVSIEHNDYFMSNTLELNRFLEILEKDIRGNKD